MAESTDVVFFESHTQVTLVEVARSSGLSEELIRELMEYGALSAGEGDALSGACVGRLREVARLREDLELDTATVALVLRFLERIEGLEARVQHLNAQVTHR
jgi:pyridoxal/pyridoxine/pyridoxamine kinase